MLSLGDIGFGLGADTRRLQDSMRVLQNFGKTVESVSRQTDRSAQQSAKALRNQEKAAVNALNKVLSLNQQLRNVAGGEKYTREVARAFRELNAELTKGPLSALAYQRALAKFNTSIAGTRRELSKLRSNQRDASDSSRNMVRALENLASASLLVAGPLSGIATRIVSLTAVVKRGGLEIAAFIAGLAAGTYAAHQLGTTILDAGKRMNQLNSMFEAVTGSTVQASGQIQNLTRIARNAGVLITDLGPAFAKFTVSANSAGFSTAKTSELFSVLSKAAAKLQLGTEQTVGIFRALEQMMSKGTVQAEELRGQLGDRLPGALQIAARAMGVTTRKLQEMMKKGQLISAEFLPKFVSELARSLRIDSRPIDNYASAIANVQNAWFQLRAELDKQLGVTDRVIQLAKVLTEWLDYIRINLDKVKIYAMAAVGAMTGLVAPGIIGGVISLATWIGRTATSMGILNKIMMANPILRLVNIALKASLAIAGVVAALYRFGDEIRVIRGELGTLKDYLDILWKDFAPATEAVMNRVRKQINDTYQAFLRDSQNMSVSFGMSWEEIGLKLLEGINKWINNLSNFATAVPIVLKAIPSGVAIVTVEAVNWMLDTINQAFQWLNGKIKGWIDSIKGSTGIGTSGGLGGILKDFFGVDSSKWLDIADWKDFEPWKVPEKYASDWAKADDEVRKIMAREKQYVDGVFQYIQSVRERANMAASVREYGQYRSQEWQKEFDPNYARFKAPELVLPDDPSSGAGAGSSKESKALQRRQQAMKALEDQIKRVREENEGLLLTERELLEISERHEREKEVERYAKALAKAGVDAEWAKEKLAELYNTLETNQALKRAKEAFEQFRDSFVNAFDSIGMSLVESLFEGENAFKSLKNVAIEAAKDILRTFMQLAVLNPLKNMIFGLDTPTLGGGGGGLLSRIFGGLTKSAKGNVFNNGYHVKRFAKGTVMDSTFTFPMKPNGIGMGAEQGPEAIMPLSRDSSGNLGVQAVGGGGSKGILEVQLSPGLVGSILSKSGDQAVDIVLAGIQEFAQSDEFVHRAIAAYKRGRKEMKIR